MLLTGFFAFPWGREQPTEVWALARIRFLLKPRKRIWDQSGIKELVTITAPKKIEKVYTDGLSQTEVRSRLQALATTIDSRGWAIKSAAMSPYTTPAFAANSDSERLIDPNSLPQNLPTDDTTVYDDVLDPTNNPKAQQFDEMLEHNAQAQRERLLSQMQQANVQPASLTTTQNQQSPAQPAADYWFLNQPTPTTTPAGTTTFGTQVTTPGAPSDTPVIDKNEEQQLVAELRAQADEQSLQYSHLPTILPLAEQEKLAKKAAATSSPQPIANNPPVAPVTPEPDAAILELAQKDDWNISTIARQAKKAHGEEPDEVVISLH